ncbi:PAAR domain-containing protein [Enterobacter oligotrophicus]|uniref:PAAR domain-containing protein n=1 Tax=Enterobacter oligotrophicus TaxID=2478464 RepID=UPI0012606F73|nr:PAAR domain-containing protein [Enterobacter oligotrophicus]ELW1647681.1 PAAR domain-containing protein [Enterobacter oligotrophicus]MBT9423937.1 PAAR domain-containing protein [Enterobacter oligotrophicus]
MKGVIRLGDPLVSGGKVINASGADFMGKPVALKDDLVECPLHKGTFAISECDPSWTMHGRGVVIDKCKAECGCEIISTLPVAGVV